MTYKKRDPFYASGAWQHARAEALRIDGGMCRECMSLFAAGKKVRPRRAQMVHHIIPILERPDLALDLANLESLCYACHERKHPEKRLGWKASAKEAPAFTHRGRIIKA